MNTRKMILIFLCALAMQGRAELCDTMTVSPDAGGSNFASYAQLIQVVNGYLIFQYKGEWSGPDGLFYYPIAFKIKSAKAAATLTEGTPLWRILPSGTVIYKIGTVEMKTISGFSHEVRLYEILHY